MSKANMKALAAFVAKNFATIIAFWDEEIDDADMRARIQSI